MVINILNLNNMTNLIDFRPVIKLLLTAALIGVMFYTVVSNSKHIVPSINMYTPPADTVIIVPPVR